MRWISIRFVRGSDRDRMGSLRVGELLQVHDLMEDIAEQQEVANEIATAISNPIGLQTDDDDELLKELEEMAAVSSLRTTHTVAYIPFTHFERCRRI